jgi:hypothetical protein
LHNDWLETRITFGWLGSALIAVAFLSSLLHWLGRGGIYGGRRFAIMLGFALAGCLVHARWDFRSRFTLCSSCSWCCARWPRCSPVDRDRSSLAPQAFARPLGPTGFVIPGRHWVAASRLAVIGRRPMSMRPMAVTVTFAVAVA